MLCASCGITNDRNAKSSAATNRNETSNASARRSPAYLSPRIFEKNTRSQNFTTGLTRNAIANPYTNGLISDRKKEAPLKNTPKLPTNTANRMLAAITKNAYTAIVVYFRFQ